MKYLNGVNYKDCVGKVCKSLNSGDFKILKYNDSKIVEIWHTINNLDLPHHLLYYVLNKQLRSEVWVV